MIGVSDLNVIEINHLTKDYGQNKGVFDVSLEIPKGEVYGYLGPNGAGKSTTMRHLMGFSKPDSGLVQILGMDCWQEQKEIQKRIGYLPGEISFPDEMTGLAYLKMIAKMRKMSDFSYAEELLAYFEINPDTGIKRMSKGMKQKIGIVAAFMHKPELLLLDEPTSGLDPLMQSKFVDLMEEVKAEGRTIILSSHIFEEVEKTCDRIGMIRQGKLIKEVSVNELRHSQLKTFKVEFKESSALEDMKKNFPQATFRDKQNQMILSINDEEVNQMIRELAKVDLRFIKEEKHTLEEYFMKFYGGNDHV